MIMESVDSQALFELDFLKNWKKSTNKSLGRKQGLFKSPTVNPVTSHLQSVRNELFCVFCNIQLDIL